TAAASATPIIMERTRDCLPIMPVPLPKPILCPPACRVAPVRCTSGRKPSPDVHNTCGQTMTRAVWVPSETGERRIADLNVADRTEHQARTDRPVVSSGARFVARLFVDEREDRIAVV